MNNKCRGTADLSTADLCYVDNQLWLCMFTVDLSTADLTEVDILTINLYELPTCLPPI